MEGLKLNVTLSPATLPSHLQDPRKVRLPKHGQFREDIFTYGLDQVNLIFGGKFATYIHRLIVMFLGLYGLQRTVHVIFPRDPYNRWVRLKQGKGSNPALQMSKLRLRLTFSKFLIEAL